MERYNEVLTKLIDFRDKRDWKQFHDSKNLATAISIEASELNELYLWKTVMESEEVDINKVKEELADILSFAFLLAEKHKLNPFDIVEEKIKINAKKYPVDKAKGTAKKYTDL
ncbi:nucleotide pyrophosphohydrolase [Ulvibacter antarcticus]|uniref:NTP pyrophosphatase (Non-canonical NTP hydrolase) n=1 Tax=Ulvibacter antarcticus TaxID=442714 RepID=A0A3L9ZIK3_9FLAO|nr:nucleotide pyrophosphohydrolase [Ulvibacter antarcticus]RMA66552.1 NTP pyrophosphatase (non-canonical NTP hydrolase) [Ulvibacter antarcticus]